MLGGSSETERPEAFKSTEDRSKGAHTPFSDQKTMYLNMQDTANEPLMASGRIFLGRLREDVDRHVLVDVLSKFGNVLDARIVAATKDGYRKRFAFCDLERIESATAAIQALHGSTDLGEPALIATHSTDTRPSPAWNSTGPVKYYGSSTAAVANIASYNHPHHFTGSRPSSFGLAWQPSQHTTMVVTAPPPPPRPAAGAQSNSNISAKNTAALESAASSSSSSSSGGVAAPQHVPSPSLPAAAAAAAPQQQEQEYPHHDGRVHVPPHMMHHPPMPMPMPIAAAGAGPAMPHHMVHPTPAAFEAGQLTTLYVRGLPVEMDEMGLLHYYMPFGTVVATKILRNLDSMRSRGAGFIEFFSRHESDAALKGTNRAMGPAGRELMVQYAPRQLHTSRGTAAAMSAPVWPVMPYPAASAAAAISAAAVPVPIPIVGVPPPTTTHGASGHTTHHQVALAMGHPMHLQAYHVPCNPYHHQGPYQHPAHGAAPAAGWQQQQHAYPHPQQHQYYAYQNYQHHHNNAMLQSQQQYAPTALAPTAYHQNHQQKKQQQQQRQQVSHSSSKPDSSAESAGSDTSSTAVRRPGDPVVVVYGNGNLSNQQQQAPMNNNQQAIGNNNGNNINADSGGLAVPPAQYAMPPYPTTNVNGGRYPLRNLSNMNGGSSGGSHSAASTPASAISLGLPTQKHISSSGGGAGVTIGNDNAFGLERTSSEPLPSALSASEMQAICSRVKSAARNVIHANNAMTANKKVHGHGSGGGNGNGTPDLVVKRVNNNIAASSSVNTLVSEDSFDSVASCGTSAASIVPTATGVRGN